MAWFSAAVGAGIGQWRDSPWEWKQGARGYGLRYGSGFATRVTRETITFSAATLLHEGQSLLSVAIDWRRCATQIRDL
jgi:hypothetical protein